MRSLCALTLSIIVCSPFAASAQDIAGPQFTSAPNSTVGDAPLPPPLPRWREGGTPYDPRQALTPFNVRAPRDTPTTGLIASPPEYDPTRGVLFKYISGHWTDVVAECVVKLTANPAHDDIAYVVVNNASQQSTAYSHFLSQGADMSKVQFIINYGNSVWLRDYGPHFIYQDGAIGIADSHYYPTRDEDNFVPTALGDDHFIVPTYDQGLYYSGGNFMPGPNRTAFMSSLINLDNPSSQGFTPQLIAEIFQTHTGIDNVHILPQLPTSVDGTGHIDMWMYVVSPTSVIISEFKPGSNPTAITITNNAVPYMEALGFNVYRAPAWNALNSGYNTHYTYTNAFRVNDRIFIPEYAPGNASYADEDEAAFGTWQDAAGPDVEIVPINCYPIIWASGAIHCIVMQVPRYADPIPSACVIWPEGGEILAAGSLRTIEWVATDTDNATIPQVDVYYSLDGGTNWELITTTTNTGSCPWTVPNASTSQALVKVVATAADLDQVEAISQDYFSIIAANQTVYDFQTGAGSDKFAYGTQTYSWSNVNANRTPVTAPLSSANYTKISQSDATGGITDPNRYRSPNPSSNYESTHIFEFTINEDPASIADLEFMWEGFADGCTQAELYIWDYVEGQWADGGGLSGQNRYMDNWAGLRDGYLTGNITENIDRYIDASGQLTLLVYAERGTRYLGGYWYVPTMHDYVSVTVTTPAWCLGDANCSGGAPDFLDVQYFVEALTGQASWEQYYAASHNGNPPPCPYEVNDFNGGGVEFTDVQEFVNSLGQPCQTY
jgi:agmatine deiminase